MSANRSGRKSSRSISAEDTSQSSQGKNEMRRTISQVTGIVTACAGLAFICPFGLSAAEDDAANLQGLSCLEGPTNEASSSGAVMHVYVRGDDVQYIDWNVDLGNRLIRQQFYFHRRSLVAVVETIHVKRDAQRNELKHPRLVSTKRYNLEGDEAERRSEFLEHAKTLLMEFRSHRQDFKPCEKTSG